MENQNLIKETFLNTLFSYLGILLGAFYMIFLFPKIFSENPEHWGSLVLVTNLAGLFLILASLATPQALIKFYPITNKNDRESLLSFLLFINIIGLALSFAIYYIYTYNSPFIINIQEEKFNITWFFYPLLVSITLFSFFEAYCHTLLKTATPTFLNNTFTRFWFFLSLLLYYFEFINFKVFTYLYFGQFICSFILLLLFFYRIKVDKIRFKFILPKNYNLILKYSIYVLPAITGAVLISKIDIQMIGELLNEAEVAYYNHAIYFMSVLLIPRNAIIQIVRAIISKDIQSNSDSNLDLKLQKINFALILSTLIIFILIFINIDDLMTLLGAKFGSTEVRYCIIILGVGRVIEAGFIINHAVLEFSNYYKSILFFEISAVLLLIILNYLLIPEYGIIGAAVTSSFIFISNSFLKMLYIKKKLKLNMLQSSHLKVLIITISLALLYFVSFKSLLQIDHYVFILLANMITKSILLLLGVWFIFKRYNLQKIFKEFH